MRLLFWRKNKHIDQHARLCADELYSQIPPDSVSDYLRGAAITSSKKIKQQKKAQGKVETIIYNTASHILEFKRAESLGVYGKARYHLTFMERLKELGYPEETTKELNQLILMRSS